MNGEWTTQEIEWLKINYPLLGRKPCARHLGRSTTSVQHKAVRLGLKSKAPRKGRAKTYDEKAICAAYLRHQDRKMVAKLFGTYPDRISQIVKRHGIKVQLKSRFRDQQEAIVKDYQANELNMKELSAKYNLSDDRIREGLTKLGLYDDKRRLLFIEPRDVMAIWIAKYGEEGAATRRTEWVAKLSEVNRGEGNSMYGKPAPQGAGNGWKGWYRDQYFRSLRELAFMVDMDAKGLEWTPGERKELTVRYEFNGAARTYRPDFRVGDTLYEVKPIKLHKTPSVMAKQEAAIRFCEERGWQYELVDIEIDSVALKKAYDAGLVRFDRDYEARFLAYLSA